MDHVLSAVLASLQADMAQMERVGMNLANVQTAGYKRDVLQSRSFGSLLEAANVEPTVQPDLSAGSLRTTGAPLDIAIRGAGWFEVLTAQGVAYTRQGNFRLDAAGRLVTQQGDPVLGLGGEIRLTQSAPVIDAEGRVFDASTKSAGLAPTGQIKVTQFEPGARMERVGEGLWRVAGDGAAAAEGTARLEQGVLENSNVSSMHEMVRLMASMRHAESMQKVAIGYDEMLATSIRRLGEGT